MGPQRMHQFATLSLHEQELLHREAARIKSEHGFLSDILRIEDLAKVLGRPAKSLRNMKSRGTMPDIPTLHIGDQSGFWIMHVAMWLTGMDKRDMPALDLRERARQEVELARPQPVSPASQDDAPKQGRHREISVAKEAILRRGMAILEEEQRRRVERSGA